MGIDWRWGERYFAAQLNDFDLAANNGGWQWKAIHAPWEASIEALTLAKVQLGSTYPKPLVAHDAARKAALARYGKL